MDLSDIERVFRSESGRAVATLVRFGDIDLAEEAVQDAFVVALQRWPTNGLPPSPAGWIITTARHRGIDRVREATATTARSRGAPARARPTRGGRSGGRRPAAPDLHVLSPGTRA